MATVIDLFRTFISECQELNINIIFVYTPVYIDGQNLIKKQREVISLYEHFAVKYSIPFFNYSTGEMCKNKELFADPTHLTKNGATIFTDKFLLWLESLPAMESESDV